MNKNDQKYRQYCDILKSELIPAMGCTEPIAVAFAAARARELLGCDVESCDVAVSGNIIKNVKSVVVPHTGGLRGIEAAVAAGIVAGDASRELEVISSVTAEQIGEIQKFIESKPIAVHFADGDNVFDIRITLGGGGNTSYVRILHDHLNIVEERRNSEIIFMQACKKPGEEKITDYSCLTVADIVDFADTVEPADIAEVIDRQIRYNMVIAHEGMTGKWGAGIGRTLLSKAPDDPETRARAYAAAGSDARMSGCELPVVINSGSGNQGLTVSVPVVVYADATGKTEDKKLRAIVLSNLIAIHLKSGIGTLSAYCGAISAGCGAGAGIAYLEFGTYDAVAHTLVNSLAIVSGVICDGAKASCAAKISSAVDAGLLGYHMYCDGHQFVGGDGIVLKGVENTIRNISSLAREGMCDTDREIIKLMIGEK